MSQYLLRRLFLIFPTFLGISLLVFTITRFVPGGPIERAIAEMRDQNQSTNQATQIELSAEQIQVLERYYGFDRPILEAYFSWLKKLSKADLGVSSRYTEDVTQMISQRLPVSLYFGFFSTLLTYLICIPTGLLKSFYHRTWFDLLSSVFIFVGYSIPTYVLGIFLLVVFASELSWFPLGGFVSTNFEDLSVVGKIIDLLQHTTLAMIAYLSGSFAVTTMILKNALLDIQSSPFMRTAISKGLSFRKALIKHALPNSLIPLATNFGNNLSLIIAGSFLIEKIYNIEGFALLGYESLIERDYPVVLGVLSISCILQLVGNLLSDVCVALVDPRIEFK